MAERSRTTPNPALGADPELDADPAAVGFDPADPGFIADPYPTLAAMRGVGRVWYYPPRRLHLITHFADVHAALRERRLGRAFRHRYTPAEFGQPEPADRRPRWSESERWSLLNLEPPDHTRIRRLVTAVFTARSIAAMRPTIEELSRATLQRLLNDSSDVGGGAGEAWDVIAAYAQPYSVAVICRLLGVPVGDGPALLAWSHAIVKMYELRSTEAEQQAAERAADEFIGYVRDLIAVRREGGEHPHRLRRRRALLHRCAIGAAGAGGLVVPAARVRSWAAAGRRAGIPAVLRDSWPARPGRDDRLIRTRPTRPTRPIPRTAGATCGPGDR